MRISGTELSSVILSQTKLIKKMGEKLIIHICYMTEMNDYVHPIVTIFFKIYLHVFTSFTYLQA